MVKVGGSSPNYWNCHYRDPDKQKKMKQNIAFLWHLLLFAFEKINKWNKKQIMWSTALNCLYPLFFTDYISVCLMLSGTRIVMNKASKEISVSLQAWQHDGWQKRPGILMQNCSDTIFAGPTVLLSTSASLCHQPPHPTPSSQLKETVTRARWWGWQHFNIAGQSHV